MRIHQWLKVLAERKGSDLYLATGAPPCAKFEGELKTISSDVLGPGEVAEIANELMDDTQRCLLYTSPSPRDQRGTRMPSSA